MRPGMTPFPVDILTDLPVTPPAGSFIVTDPRGNLTHAYALLGQAAFYRISLLSGALQQLPSPPAGAGGLLFGAGTCAVYDPSMSRIWVLGSGQLAPDRAWTGHYNTLTGVWTSVDAGGTLDALLGGLWGTDGVMAHPCTTVAAAASDDFIYLCGNNAAAAYRYQITLDTWTTVPPAARGAIGGAGTTLVWPWAINVDRLYAVDGGGLATQRWYSIAGNAWTALAPIPPWTELPTTGTCACSSTDGRYVFIRENATETIFIYDPITSNTFPLGKITTTDGAATVGGRLCSYETGGVHYVVTMIHGSSQVQRIRIVE